MRIYKDNGYRKLAQALEPLELEGRLRYLPAFECCGSCAGARLSSEEWGGAEVAVTFHEQTRETADDTCELWLTVRPLGSAPTADQRVAATELVEEALLTGGFRRVPAPPEATPPALDPTFALNTFYGTASGALVVRAGFEKKPKPTKAVRARVKELQLNH